MPKEIEIEIKYCTGCGAPIENLVRLRYCPFCGSADEGKKFCGECGASLLDLPTKQATAAATGVSTTTPEGAAKLAKAYCPDCKKEATWVSQYNQWYCYNCQKYVTNPSYSEPK